MENTGTLPDDGYARFLRGWRGYVLELSGIEEADLETAYRDEVRWLREKADREGGLEIWRMAVLPAGTDHAELCGRRGRHGRFWTLSRRVAENWQVCGLYDEDHSGGIPVSGTATLLSARAGIDEIDLVETAACRMGSSNEDEVRLKRGAGILVLSAVPLDGDGVSPPSP